MTHGVIGNDGVKCIWLERERNAGINGVEPDTIGQSIRLRQAHAVIHAVRVDINSSNATPPLSSEVRRGTAGPAAHFQYVGIRGDLEPVREPKPLARGHPTALPDILTIGLLP